MINNICSTADNIGKCTSIPEWKWAALINSFGIYGVGQPSHPSSCLSCVVPVACLSRTAHFPPLCRSKQRPRGQTRTQRIRSVGSAWGRRSRSSLSWREEQPSWRGSNFRRCSPRPAGSAPGGRHKPLSASPRAAAAPGAGAGRLRQASVSPAAGGGQAPSRLPPGSVLRLSPPGEDYSARRSLRAAHTPPPVAAIAASCQPVAGPARPRARGCAAGQAGQGKARQGRGCRCCGRWPHSGAAARWSWAAPAPSRAGERLLAASLRRPERSCGRGSWGEDGDPRLRRLLLGLGGGEWGRAAGSGESSAAAAGRAQPAGPGTAGLAARPPRLPSLPSAPSRSPHAGMEPNPSVGCPGTRGWICRGCVCDGGGKDNSPPQGCRGLTNS